MTKSRTDAGRRREMGLASRELVASWGYEPSIETLIRIVRQVAGRAETTLVVNQHTLGSSASR